MKQGPGAGDRVKGFRPQQQKRRGCRRCCKEA